MTMILGKDTSLQNAAGLMKAKLQALGFDIEEVEWHNPVPHVWSVRLEDRSCAVFVAQGKGSSQEAAQVSALASLFASLSQSEALLTLHQNSGRSAWTLKIISS